MKQNFLSVEIRKLSKWSEGILKLTNDYQEQSWRSIKMDKWVPTFHNSIQGSQEEALGLSKQCCYLSPS